jgi:hypothetical protein
MRMCPDKFLLNRKYPADHCVVRLMWIPASQGNSSPVQQQQLETTRWEDDDYDDDGSDYMYQNDMSQVWH